MAAMNIAMEEACDTGLVLGLGRCNPSFKSKPSSTTPKVDLGPSLTLALSDDAYWPNSKEAKEANWQSTPSPHSTNSSFSSAHLSNIKRENDVVGNEETERGVSSRTSDEEEEGGVRKKLRLTKEQSALLEDKFKEHTTLNPKQKQALAKQLNLRPRQVEVWFQNRRARTKLKQTEVDCEVLKRCCETLSDENRRLQKELEELKALKLTTSPIYMQMTAAAATTAVTVCPSCERVSGVAEGATAGPFVVAAPKAQFLNPFARSAAC